jgi:hypothetical protein
MFFSKTFVRTIFRYDKCLISYSRDAFRNTCISSCSVLYCNPILIKIRMFRQSLVKLDIKFHNSYRVLLLLHADRRGEAHRRVQDKVAKIFIANARNT